MKAFPPKNPTGGTVTGGDPSSSAAYSPTGASYGCSLGARNWAKATGAITTVYIWVPSTIPDPNNPTTQIPDPLDVAPTQVISVETCTAHANGQSYFPLGTSATASCSNGLGFNSTDWSGPLLSGNWPYGVIIGVGATSDSTGTLYTSR